MARFNRVARRKKDNYHYVLIGLVGAVALLSLFLIAATFSPDNFFSGNLLGQATEGVEYNGVAYDATYLAEGAIVLRNDAEVTLDALGPTSATLTLNDGDAPTTVTLHVGESGSAAGLTVTLYELTESQAGVVIAEQADACTTADEQTPLCRGGSACCGGLCAPLPDCSRELDGGVFVCGQRNMYCCNGELTFQKSCEAPEGGE